MSDSRIEQRKGRAVAVVIAKWIIGLIVIVGLFLAARRAVHQWQAESERLELAVAEVDQQLDSTTDLAQREALERRRESLERSVPRLSNLRWDRIGLACLLYGLGLFPPAMLLRSAIHCLGQETSIRTAVAAQLLGHAGKYVPGKAMVIVLRAGALGRDGVRPWPATIGVFLETFLMMAVGASLGAIVVLWLPVPRWIASVAIAMAACACLPTLPPVLRRVAQKMIKTDLQQLGSRIDWRLFAAGWGWSLLSWLLVGASFALLISAIPTPTPLPATFQLYAIGTAAISLAVVVGFASLIPGGAGVRELVLTTILGVSIGPVQGILSAIAARIVFIVVESLLASASWIWLRRQGVTPSE